MFKFMINGFGVCIVLIAMISFSIVSNIPYSLELAINYILGISIAFYGGNILSNIELEKEKEDE